MCSDQIHTESVREGICKIRRRGGQVDGLGGGKLLPPWKLRAVHPGGEERAEPLELGRWHGTGGREGGQREVEERERGGSGGTDPRVAETGERARPQVAVQPLVDGWRRRLGAGAPGSLIHIGD